MTNVIAYLASDLRMKLLTYEILLRLIRLYVYAFMRRIVATYHGLKADRIKSRQLMGASRIEFRANYGLKANPDVGPTNGT